MRAATVLAVTGWMVLLAAAPAGAQRVLAAPETSEMWTRYGTGDVRHLAIADVDGEDSGEVLVAGRGVAAIGRSTLDSGRPLWTWKSLTGTAPDQGGDVEFLSELAVGDLNGDGRADAAVGTSQGLRGLDGATGRVLWTVTGVDVQALALGDFDGDGAQDVVISPWFTQEIIAYDGRDGSEQWRYTRTPVSVTRLLVSDVNSDGAPDVLVGGSPSLFFPDLQVISGLGAAATGHPLPLWSAETDDPTAVSVGDVEPGGTPEVVVANFNGGVHVLNGADGQELGGWTAAEDGRLEAVELVEIDGDAGLEIVVGIGHEDDRSFSRGLKAYDMATAADGPLWSWEAPQPVMDLSTGNLDSDPESELVVAGGWRTFGGREEHDGFVAMVDPRDGRPLWTRDVPGRVAQVATGHVMGEPAVVAGNTHDGGVHAFSPEGAPLWTHLTGGAVHAIGHGDLDGDGSPELIEGNNNSTLSAYTSGGTRVFERRVPHGGGPDVTTVAAGDLDGEPGDEVVAGTFEYWRPGPGGFVHVYDGAGRRLWSAGRTGDVGTVVVADLDGGGSSVIAGSNGLGLSGEGAQLARWRADGTVVWDVPLPPSMADLPVEVTDLNGDETLDLMVGAFPLGRAIVLGFDGASGEELWRTPMDGTGQWLHALPDGTAAFGDSAGRIALIDRDGGVRWQVDAGDGSARDGQFTVDGDGDGVRDIVASFDDDQVRLVSGVDGHDLWTAPFGAGPEEWGGPVATARSDDADVILAGASSNVIGRREDVIVLDPRTGERLGALPTLFHVFAIHVADLDQDGDDEAMVGAGWQLHVFDPDGDRVPPPVRAVGPAEASRRNEYTLRFEAGPQDSPLAAAHVQVCGEDCAAATRIPLAPQQTVLEGLHVPAEGRWTMRMWLEDEAGNRDPALVSAPVEKILDLTTPTVVHEGAATFAVSDALSGIERATLEVHGDGIWRTLEGVRLEDGFVSGPQPDRRVRLRATAVDRAGNETAVEVAAGVDPTASGTPASSAPSAPSRCTLGAVRSRGTFSARLRLVALGRRVVVRAPRGFTRRLRRLALQRRTACGWEHVRATRPGARLRLPAGRYRLRATLRGGRVVRGRAAVVRVRDRSDTGRPCRGKTCKSCSGCASDRRR